MNTAYVMWKGCSEPEVLKNVMDHNHTGDVIHINLEIGPRTEENNFCIEYDTLFIPVKEIEWIKVQHRNDKE